MGTDLHVKAILQRGNGPAATGIVFRVGAGDDDDVERQADLEPFDLNVFFLHQIKQTNLDLLSQVREFVDGEDAAVGTRNKTIVDSLFISQIASFGHLDGINLTDEV